MPLTPELRARDIQLQIASVLKRHSLRPVALHGTGEAQQVEVDDAVWTVVPTRSELDLRRALRGRGTTDRIVLLVDHANPLPLDLAGRLAGRRVHTIDRSARVANLFHARKASPAMLGSKLATILLDEMPEGLRPTLGTVLQPLDAWHAWLQLTLGLPIGTVLDPAALAVWGSLQPAAGPTFSGRRNDAAWRRALAELSELVRAHGPPAAGTVWQACLDGRLEELLAWALLIDGALRTGSTDARRALRTGLGYRPGMTPDLAEDPVASGLVETLDPVLRAMDDAQKRSLFQLATQLIPAEGFDEGLAATRWLPAGQAQRLHLLAEALEQAVVQPSALPACVSALRQVLDLSGPDLSPAAQHAQSVQTMAVRLACWHAWPDDQHLTRLVGADATVQIAAWYNREGGWVDHAREVLRTQSSGHTGLDDVVRTTLLPRIDGAREALDRHFAAGLGAWHDQHQPSQQVLPIHQVLDTVAGAVLREHEQRRMLVIVLDGMSVAVSEPLLQSLDGWAPVAWTPGRRRHMPPALAALPSLTATSRADLFAGRHRAQHGGESEGRDVARFAEHPGLAGLGPEGGSPVLFGKAALGAGASLHAGLEAAIADTHTRLVATIINAVDDQLGGSDQIHVDYERPQAIPLLAALLRAAEQSGRMVLLTSDHGHIPASQLSSQPRPEHSGGEGSRWRTLSPSQEPVDDEILLPDGSWSPDSRRVAMFWNPARCWGRSSKGVHGGASLAEVVVPVRLVAPAWLRDATPGAPDDALAVQERQPPRWWCLEGPPQARATASPAASPQLSLLPAAPPPQAAVPRSLSAALRASPLFRASASAHPQDRVEQAIHFVEVLLDAPGNALSFAAFASRTGVRQRRILGRISNIAGLLNVDGIATIECNEATQQVRLNRARMVAQFALEHPDG